MRALRVLCIIIIICLCFSVLCSSALATSISYWYASGTNDVYYYSVPIYGSVGYYQTGSYTCALTGLSNGVSKWNSANFLPFSLSYNSITLADPNANVWYYGGDRSYLSQYFSGITSSVYGITSFATSVSSTTVYYGASAKTVHMLDGSSRSRVAIVDQGLAPNPSYVTVGAHEMGHVLGWYGHSSNPSQLMYSAASVSSVLSEDKLHIKQIYDLFY